MENFKPEVTMKSYKVPMRWKDIERVFDQYIKLGREWEEAEKEIENT